MKEREAAAREMDRVLPRREVDVAAGAGTALKIGREAEGNFTPPLLQNRT
jgi:hypothetical protein